MKDMMMKIINKKGNLQSNVKILPNGIIILFFKGQFVHEDKCRPSTGLLIKG